MIKQVQRKWKLSEDGKINIQSLVDKIMSVRPNSEDKDSGNDGNLSDSGTIDQGPVSDGASKQADGDIKRRATLEDISVIDLRKLLGLDTKNISKAKNAPAKQKYYKKGDLVDMIMADRSIVVE